MITNLDLLPKSYLLTRPNLKSNAIPKKSCLLIRIDFQNSHAWLSRESLEAHSDINPYLAAITRLHKLFLPIPNLHSNLPKSALLWNLILLITKPPAQRGRQTLLHSTKWYLWCSIKSFHKKLINLKKTKTKLLPTKPKTESTMTTSKLLFRN